MELGPESMVRDVVDISVSRQDKGLVAVATAGGALAYLPLANIPNGLTSVQLFRILVSQEPTESEAAQWAVDHHRSNPDHTATMATRVRLASMAPRLNLSGAAASGIPYFYLDNGTANYPVTRTLQNQFIVLGTATWRLDYLVARPYEGNVMREHLRMLKERDRVWRKVLRAYEQRRRMQMDMMTRPSRSAGALGQRRVKLDQLTATLDGLTDGRFSLEARRRGAPGDGVSVRMPFNVKDGGK